VTAVVFVSVVFASWVTRLTEELDELGTPV
jgi:hypothetical protein